MTVALIWTILSVLAFVRQVHTYKEARADLRALGGATNGRNLIAREQIEAAWQHALIQFFFLCAGVLALLVPLPVEERPELTVRAIGIPLLLIAAQVFAVIRHERAALVRRRLLAEPLPDGASEGRKQHRPPTGLHGGGAS